MALRRLTAIRDLAALLCTENAETSGCVRGYWSASQTRSGAQTAQQTSTDWAYWRAASAAAVGLACLLQDTESPAHCLTSPSDTEESVSEPLTADLQRWLASIGAETDAISIRDSTDVRDQAKANIREHLALLGTINLHSACCSIQVRAWVSLPRTISASRYTSAGGNSHGTGYINQMTGLCLQAFHYKLLLPHKLSFQTLCLVKPIRSCLT